MRLEPTLEVLGTNAIRDALGVEAPAVIRAANPSHGDYQLNGVLPLAKQLKKVPRELAQAVAERLQTEAAIASAEVAGPGFINLKLDPAWVAAQTGELARDGERDGVPKTEKPLRTVVDFSSPNIAKQMHVGHLRSTIIGDAICRLLRFIGHEVIADNHLGDWGTQFGLLIVGMREFGSQAALDAEPIEELERIYKLVSAKAKEDPATSDAARAELAKLQRGDAESRRTWERFASASRHELEATYARLGVTFDQWLGESAYEDMLPGVIEELKQKGVARIDEGALCVFFEDQPELGKSPFIVQKKDGAYLYATTDIATVEYRRDHFRTERAVYVVDKRQALHFKQLFATVRKLGIEMELEHVSFGSVLGKDGKPLKTREGGTIKLSELLDEATSRSAERMRSAREENVLELSDQQIDELAPVVGIGAVRYADLMQNRSSDYQFDWDKMISFKGNAGPYLQYAHARIAALFRKGEVDPTTLSVPEPIALAHPAELALAKHLLRFGDAVTQAAEQSLPHLVAEHLYDLARLFSVFYEACPVLKAEPAERAARLLLASLAGRQLRRGLGLLGIEAPERM